MLRVFLGAVCLLLAAPVLRAAEAIEDSSCMDCHSDKDLYKTNASGRAISLFVEPEKLKAGAHKTNSCWSCHSDITSSHPDDEIPAKPVNCASCHERQSASYGASVHGLALANGEQGSATCTDCHGTHDVLPPTAVESPLHFSRLAETCGSCHDDAARDMAESVHGKAMARGHREAPTCTDCHSEHEIHGLKGTSPRVSAETCSVCHASEKLNTKFRLPKDRVQTFFESYHGLAAKFGSTVAANCGSCHGSHLVLPSSDPRSTIHPSNLSQTCGQCHPGATENFANSKIHVDPSSSSASDLGGKVNFWVRQVYLVLIFGTIGFMLFHNAALFIKKVAARRKALHLTIERMDQSQRVQHAILAISFIILAITGFALKWPDSWISRMLGSHEGFRSWSHRIAGVVLILAGIYHIYYLLAKREGRRLLKDLLPSTKDAADLVKNGKYLTGLTPEKAKIGRFGYSEKMEYWAVVWGTVIMGVTGFMMWFPVEVTRFMPRWLVDVATTIHYYEAILACLAIIVWHFYHVIFDPDVYPINWAAISGKVTEHWQQDEHPLEQLPEQQAPQPMYREHQPAKADDHSRRP